MHNIILASTMNTYPIASFLDRLRATRFYEDAALLLLGELVSVAKTTLQESRYAKRGRVLRGMAHLRPGDGYRRLVAFDDTAPRGEPVITHIPSASAWRWVVQHECTREAFPAATACIG